MACITNVLIRDVRFPTSLSGDGADAMNRDADYSAVYVVLETDVPSLQGFGFTFTIGRGTDVVALAARVRARSLIGQDSNLLGDLYRLLKSDSQMRWLGPEKGAEHLATAALMNAAWDLAAREAGKPLWQFVTDMDPEHLVSMLDFQYLSDAITPAEAVNMLSRSREGREERIAWLSRHGYPSYTTSPGWLGYSDDKMEQLCREAVSEGFRHIKLKVGASLHDDLRRLEIARRAVGPDVHLMIDANQTWDVEQAIEWVNELSTFNPLWIEEPTSPDDILGHARIRRSVSPVRVATGEHGMNRVLFKQLIQAGAIDYCQIDSARLASLNEILPIYFLAHKAGIPVCPHAGGVGLCELVQHLSVIDFVAISMSVEDRVTEYVDHLHEHFVDPCIVREGAYVLPLAPGYSAEIHESSIREFEFPDGDYWRLALAADHDESVVGEGSKVSAPGWRR